MSTVASTTSCPTLPYGRRHYHDPEPGAPALQIEHLSVAYPGSRRLALRDVSLVVPVGARVALVGPNGAGKSTLLKAVAKLLPIQSGSILIYGHPPGGCHHRVAYLPQRGEIDWHFPITLRRLVMTGRYVHLGWINRPTRADWAIVDAVIEQLALGDLAERQIGQLSGGQQQRALLARALAQDADLLLLDEPLNAVDASTRAIVADVLARLSEQGKTVVAATHDLGRLETDFDGALYLANGREIAPPPGAFIGMKVGL
ncbi:MAG: metal ABC transporter ATP-binding protein [Candidatus Flexifilum sp.]|jgi:manganese/zinc/iron transport system ATP- binding protein